jgi:NADPH2:quinone reductase
MFAIQARAAGGPDVLEPVDIPVPTPGPGEILVRNQAIGLNFIDTYQRSGLYPIAFPAVLGGEAAGVVEAIGEGVTRFRVGDRAYAMSVSGAYAQAMVAHQDRCVRLPDDITLEIATAATLKGMTAEFLVRRCHLLAADETVLVHAAAGGVGQILVQWAKAVGATVIATAGGADKLAIAQSLGADHIIDYRAEDVAARARQITDGQGVRVVYDGVGAATFEGSVGSLARRGLLVSFGNASGPVPPLAPLRLMEAGSIYLTRPTLWHYIATPTELDDSAAALFEMIRTGQVKISIGQTFALKDMRQAHEALEGRRTVGSTILIP